MNLKRLIGCEDMTWLEIGGCMALAVGFFLYLVLGFIDAMG